MRRGNATFVSITSCAVVHVSVCVYHNLSKWTHLHDVLELLIHVSEGELACKGALGSQRSNIILQVRLLSGDASYHASACQSALRCHPASGR